MNDADYRHLLQLLHTALALCDRRPASSVQQRRRLRAIRIELELLRARFRRPVACLQRN
jgi:hypothetical protein